jgi:O-antigen/teichoic acid export membrane protein
MLKVLKNFLADTWQKAARTFWLFFRYLMSQIGIQAMNFVIGLMIIRSMAKEEYAAYTIMNTLVPVMLMLSDTGITNALMAIGRVAWEDNEKMGRLVTTGMQLRRQFAMFSFLIVGPFLAWMLFHNNVPIWNIAILMTASLTGISFQLTGAVMKTVLGIRQQFDALMKMGLASTFLRLALTGGVILLFSHISAFFAILAGTFAILLETYMALRATKPQILNQAPVDAEYQATIYSLVKKTLPLTIYFCFQAQISVWLISIFGSAHQVADLGAASRLALIFTTIGSSYAGIMAIKFARSNGRTRLFVQFLQIIGGLALILMVVVLSAYFVPGPFIWLLGPKYTNMSGLIWLVILSSGSGTLAGAVFNLNTIKGWIPPAIITIPVEIVTQIALLVCLDVSKIQNVLIFSGLSAIPPGIVVTVMLLRRIRMEPNDEAASANPVT